MVLHTRMQIFFKFLKENEKKCNVEQFQWLKNLCHANKKILNFIANQGQCVKILDLKSMVLYNLFSYEIFTMFIESSDIQSLAIQLIKSIDFMIMNGKNKILYRICHFLSLKIQYVLWTRFLCIFVISLENCAKFGSLYLLK